jgi:hypothetical protein
LPRTHLVQRLSRVQLAKTSGHFQVQADVHHCVLCTGGALQPSAKTVSRWHNEQAGGLGLSRLH